MNKYFLTIIIILFLSGSVYPQVFRNLLNGEINIAPHPDNSLNLFDYGRNPAWLIKDEEKEWLKINPVFSDISGDYKRQYDYEHSNFYGLSFTGNKPLAGGTFLGSAAYSLEDRQNVYRSLKYDTYAGEAFFSTDSMTGDFIYRGPSVGFTYSFELIPDLFIGSTAKYGLLDGLKQVYSKAKTLFREFEGDLGLAYRFNDKFVVGSSFGIYDSQEKIDSRMNEQMQVEIYNFRGETNSIVLRSNGVTQKIRKQALSIGGQLFSQIYEQLQFAIKIKYIENGTKIFIPRSGIQNNEEGYADQKIISLGLQGRYRHSEFLSLGGYTEYYNKKSWSKNSYRNLLLWDWNVMLMKAGGGITLFIKEADILVAGEIEYNHAKADSNKHIDHRSSIIDSDNYLIKLCAELKISDGFFVNAGISRGLDEYDLIAGGKHLRTNNLSLGFCRQWTDMQASILIRDKYAGPGSGKSRNLLLAVIEIKYFNF